jgi:FAD:protein FMN transferase
MLDTNFSSKIHRFAHKAMATVFEVLCEHEDQSYAAQAARAAFDLIDRLETELTGFRASSDVTRINRLRPGEKTAVGMWTMDCLLIARHFFNETGGAFDISLGTGFPSLELIPAEPAVRAGDAGVRLNLGGIGKGYALDRAAELLEEWELRKVLLHGGYSSVLALDPPEGSEGWLLTISVPESRPPKTLGRFPARHQSWSASGTRKKDHIVDPTTGKPIRQDQSVWVSGDRTALSQLSGNSENPDWGTSGTGISPSAVAEALSTAFMVLPLEGVASFQKMHSGADVRMLRFDPAGGSHVLITFSK